MADNTELNVGSGGDVIATDDISGVKYQRCKVTIGDNGTNDGDVSATNPLPSYNPDRFVAISETATGVTGTISLGGAESAGIHVSDWASGVTFTVEGSYDGVNYFNLPAINPATNQYFGLTHPIATGNGNDFLLYNLAGMASVQVNITAISSGTFEADLRVTDITPKIAHETVRAAPYGALSVGSTAQALVGSTLYVRKGVLIKANGDNTDYVYVGGDSSVTVSNGIQLDAGEAIFIPVDNANTIHVIDNINGTNVRWMAF